MSLWVFWISFILLTGLGMASDVPFVFNDITTSIADYSSDQIKNISAQNQNLEGVPIETFQSNGRIDIEEKVEPSNPVVRHEAALLAQKYSGDHNIEQICSIFSYLKKGDDTINSWSYINDPRGVDYYEYANESLQIGRVGGYAGSGDCDDFAILMSALIEAIGGTSRIIIASHNNGNVGHAFTEVYLGRDDGQNNMVGRIISWLMDEYDTSKIYVHVDTDTKDVWLNLDWSANHPGGRFYIADEYDVHFIRDEYAKTSLKVHTRRSEPTNTTPDFASAPTPYTPKSAESIGLQAPLETTTSQQQTPTSQESMHSLISTNQNAAYAESTATNSQYNVLIEPTGNPSANRLYLAYAPRTVISCNLYASIQQWISTSRAGRIYLYEWYPSGLLDIQDAGRVSSPGWYKKWFFADTLGWHILQYHCGEWSNYVYIYVQNRYERI